MPVKVVKKGKNYVVVEAASGRKTPSSGKFKSRRKAQKQANAINASLHKRGKI
jgi:hypothetical protein